MGGLWHRLESHWIISEAGVPALASTRPKEVAQGWAVGTTNQGQEVRNIISREAFTASATSASVALPGCLS